MLKNAFVDFSQDCVFVTSSWLQLMTESGSDKNVDGFFC